MKKPVIRCRTRVTLPGTAWKGVTMRLKSSPENAIAEARLDAEKRVAAAEACTGAFASEFKVETVLPMEDGRVKVVKTLQKGYKRSECTT